VSRWCSKVPHFSSPRDSNLVRDAQHVDKKGRAKARWLVKEEQPKGYELERVAREELEERYGV
jgi:hypothetical protein